MSGENLKTEKKVFNVKAMQLCIPSGSKDCNAAVHLMICL
jgi:hypothetical protein